MVESLQDRICTFDNSSRTLSFLTSFGIAFLRTTIAFARKTGNGAIKYLITIESQLPAVVIVVLSEQWPKVKASVFQSWQVKL
jgi:hypothetical protein